MCDVLPDACATLFKLLQCETGSMKDVVFCAILKVRNSQYATHTKTQVTDVWLQPESKTHSVLLFTLSSLQLHGAVIDQTCDCATYSAA